MRVLHVIASMDPSTGGPPAVASRLAAGQTMCLGQRGSVTILSHEAPGRGYHWGMATFHPSLPRHSWTAEQRKTIVMMRLLWVV